MVTLCIISAVAVVGLAVVIGLIALIGTVFTGVLAIALDVVIGLAPFILIYALYRLYKKWRKGDEPN